MHVKTGKMYLWISFLKRSILVVNFLDVNGKLSSWSKNSLLHILFLDIAVGVVIHDVVADLTNDVINVHVCLSVIDAKNVFENRFDTCSLLKL